MSDEKQQCPEYGCPLTLTEQELLAHLEWDHNYSSYRAKEKLQND